MKLWIFNFYSKKTVAIKNMTLVLLTSVTPINSIKRKNMKLTIIYNNMINISPTSAMYICLDLPPPPKKKLQQMRGYKA